MVRFPPDADIADRRGPRHDAVVRYARLALAVALAALAVPDGALACTLVEGGPEPDADMTIAPLDTDATEKTVGQLDPMRINLLIESVSSFAPVEVFANGAWSSRGPKTIERVKAGTRVRLFGRYAVSTKPAAPMPYLLALTGGCGTDPAIPLDRTLAVERSFVIVEGTLVKGKQALTPTGREVLPLRLIDARIVAEGPGALEQVLKRGS